MKLIYELLHLLPLLLCAQVCCAGTSTTPPLTSILFSYPNYKEMDNTQDYSHMMAPFVQVFWPRLDFVDFISLSQISKTLHEVTKSIKQIYFVFLIGADQQLKYFSPKSVKITSNTTDIPKTAKYVSFVPSFNQPIEPFFTSPPPSLTHLILSTYFNQPIRSFPPTVTHLTIGDNFMQPIHSLPPSLIFLSLGTYFNYEIEHLLPPTLKYLAFGVMFKKSISNIPPSITHLTLGTQFDFPVPSLPPALTHLTFGDDFDQRVRDTLPHSLTHLTFGYSFNRFINTLPPYLTSLTLGTKFNQIISSLPLTLIYLTFGDKYNHSVDEFLPYLNSLSYLSFGLNFNQPLEDEGRFLPDSLTYLSFNEAGHFDQTLSLPPYVTSLILPKSYIGEIPFWPDTLEFLHLAFDYPLPEDISCATIIRYNWNNFN